MSRIASGILALGFLAAIITVTPAATAECSDDRQLTVEECASGDEIVRLRIALHPNAAVLYVVVSAGDKVGFWVDNENTGTTVGVWHETTEDGFTSCVGLVCLQQYSDNGFCFRLVDTNGDEIQHLLCIS